MNTVFVLKVLRKLYSKAFGGYQLPPLERVEDPNKASEMIYNLLVSDKPCMIARFGSTEMSAIINYLGIISKNHSVLNFIKGKQPEWWWNKNIMRQMQQWSGFFPPTPENMQKFGELMLEDSKEVDILGSWLKQEFLLNSYMSSCKKISFFYLEPFLSENPWSIALKGKKVLVIHPFAESIEKQYLKREFLFDNKDILPQFDLLTIKAVQSLGGSNLFKNWFEALNWMKNEMDKVDYDICLIGCGAYGFPLAAHAKRMGKKAVHIGGALQLLFGIKGKRWDNSRNQFYNDYWIRPNDTEKPNNAENIEGSCYW